MINSLWNSVPTSWLVGYWKLDGNANAEVGTNGVWTNVTWWTDWVRGYQKGYGIFNGTTAYVQVADFVWIDLTSSYTLSTWIYMTALPTSWNLYAIIDKNVWNRNWYEFELWNNWWTQVIFISHLSASAATTYSINYTLPTNQWILLQATFSWSTINFWLNWQVIWTVTSVSTIPTAWTSVLEIGRNPALSSRYFSWRMDLVRIYNTALSQSEIELLYREWKRLLGPSNIASYPSLLSGLVGYWDMKGTAHNIVDWVAGTVTWATLTTDRFGYSNWAYSFAWWTDKITIASNFYSSSSYSTEVSFNVTTLPTAWNAMYLFSHTVDFWNWVWCYLENVWWTQYIRYTNYFSSWNIVLSYQFTLTTWIWYNIVCKSWSDWMKIFLNWTQVATNANTGTLRATANNFWIWQYPTWWWAFIWKIDELKILNRSLSADEVSQLYLLTSKDYIYSNKDYNLPNFQEWLVLHLNWSNNWTTTMYDISWSWLNWTVSTTPTYKRQWRVKTVSLSTQSISWTSTAFTTSTCFEKVSWKWALQVNPAYITTTWVSSWTREITDIRLYNRSFTTREQEQLKYAKLWNFVY